MPNDRRMWAVFRALDRGWTVEELHELTKIDRWFLVQFSQIVELQRSASLVGLRGISRDMLRTLKRVRLRRSRAWPASSAPTKPSVRAEPARAGIESGVQAHRHLRRRVRVVHAVHVRHLRG